MSAEHHRPPRRFAPAEPCAIDPRAFGFFFDEDDERAPEVSDGVAVIRVTGPLSHHRSWWGGASYEGLREQAARVVAEGPRAVVLLLDSPGGVVAGCFDTVQALREIFDGTKVYAYVAGAACSAAYALATAADEIVSSPTGLLGSIGVIDAMVDVTASDATRGERWAFITSGARKTDGQPHAPLTDDAVAARQAIVDAFAEQFFALVGTRRGVSADTIRALEAGVLTAASAVTAGLADSVEPYSSFLARVRAGEPTPKAGGPAMAADKDEDDVVAKLRKMAEGDGEEAKRAKRALAAYEDDPDDESTESKAEGDDDESNAEGDDEETKSKASARQATATSTVVKLTARLAALEAKAEADERSALLATRPDLPSETREWLASLPLADAKAAIKAIPVIPGRPQRMAATATVPATRGAAQGDSTPRLDPKAKEELDRRMGLVSYDRTVVDEGNRLVLGAVTPRKGE